MSNKWKRKIYKDRNGHGGRMPMGDGHYDPNSRLDPETNELKSDPFHYGRKRLDLSETEKKELLHNRARDRAKYGVGAVTGAGSVSSGFNAPTKYRIINKPPAMSESAKLRIKELSSPKVSNLARINKLGKKHKRKKPST